MTRRRSRKHIPLCESLAPARACLLPQAVRDDLRARRVHHSVVNRMFTDDHIILHTWGGSDKWWNLDPRIRDASLKNKDAADTSRAAKAVRIQRVNEDFARQVLGKPPRTEPKRTIASRPFPQGHRPLRSGNSFRRRTP